jgi:hypothetical protein
MGFKKDHECKFEAARNSPPEIQNTAKFFAAKQRKRGEILSFLYV